MTAAEMHPAEYRCHCGLPKSEAEDQHVRVLRVALQRGRPVSLKAVVAYGIPLPGCYEQRGSQYVVANAACCV